MQNPFWQKWLIAFKILPLVALVIALKVGAHYLGWEVLSLNPLFTGLIAASVFLLGFLISGVLTDYKESEKLPGELAVNIEALFQEVAWVYKSKKEPVAQEYLAHIVGFIAALKNWFARNEATNKIIERLEELNDFCLPLEPLTQVSYIVRMKESLALIRRTIIRIETIRDTSFVSSGYAIAEVIILLVSFGLVLVKAEPFYETLFFGALVVFILLYMLALIHNLDDPFEYTGRMGSLDEVSLKPLDDAEERMKQTLQQWEKEERRLALRNSRNGSGASQRAATHTKTRNNHRKSKAVIRAR